MGLIGYMIDSIKRAYFAWIGKTNRFNERMGKSNSKRLFYDLYTKGMNYCAAYMW